MMRRSAFSLAVALLLCSVERRSGAAGRARAEARGRRWFVRRRSTSTPLSRTTFGPSPFASPKGRRRRSMAGWTTRCGGSEAHRATSISASPRSASRPSEKTEFRILYDDKKIYFGVWLWDSDASRHHRQRDEARFRAQSRRSAEDHHRYVPRSPQRASTSAPTRSARYKDANTVENGRTINYDWNVVWDNKTSIDDKGWYVELAIPLSQLRFKTADRRIDVGPQPVPHHVSQERRDVLGAVPARVGRRTALRASRMPACSAACATSSARRRIEFLPFVLPEAARDYGTAASTDGRHRREVGGDFKIGVTDDLTADLTYHTDFAQVEADQEVVNLTRFSLFFPEKRQFFTESAGIFDYGKSASSLGGDAAAADPGILPLSTAGASAWTKGRRCRSSAAAS